MLLGIDVGGTHTDAVLINDTGIVASFKVRTNHEDLLSSINAVLDDIVQTTDPGRIERLNLSTTLTTNAIVEGRSEQIGMIISGGPGIDPSNFQICPDYFIISGSTDHRGSVISPLNEEELWKAVSTCRERGITSFAAVTKFSPRNPAFENRIKTVITEMLDGEADIVTLGQEMTGRLNFPRRIATAYYNSAVWRQFNAFANAVTRSLRRYDIHCKVNILKADGGTMPLSMARRTPVESILSGPAASVMGIFAMCDINTDSIILDIGGTTTDIAIFAQGMPLMERDGIAIGSYPTLVRALHTRSIGVGGDSAISVIAEQVAVGPQRLGPSMADGGKHPTLIDAFNYLDKAAHGDVAASKAGIEAYANDVSMRPREMAEAALKTAFGKIHSATRDLLHEVNSRPVYTIHELLEDVRIVPRKIYIMGGPAKVFHMEIFREFQLHCTVPDHHEVANAVGAAMTRTTADIELHADTERGKVYLPALNQERTIGANYTLEDAQKEAKRQLLIALHTEGVPAREENVEITEATEFNMVSDYGMASAKNIRVKCQIRPGILHRYKKLLGTLC